MKFIAGYIGKNKDFKVIEIKDHKKEEALKGDSTKKERRIINEQKLWNM